MTLEVLIERFDMLYPNALSYSEKVNMISGLEGRIYHEIHSQYADFEGGIFNGYSAETPGNTLLRVLFPYDDIYIKFLSAQNDCINGDTVRYVNSADLFNRSFEEYASIYNRKHAFAAKNCKNM